jgi:hypothetical protein
MSQSKVTAALFVFVALTVATSFGAACGIERWSVKILSDPDHMKIVKTPRQSSVHELRGFPKPAKRVLHAHETSRIQPPEVHIVTSFTPCCSGTDTNVMTKTSIWCSRIPTINQKRLLESCQIPSAWQTPLRARINGDAGLDGEHVWRSRTSNGSPSTPGSRIGEGSCVLSLYSRSGWSCAERD